MLRQFATKFRNQFVTEPKNRKDDTRQLADIYNVTTVSSGFSPNFGDAVHTAD